MALNYTEINTIKNWFKTGLKPNQQQFWSTWDSFWHKSETLPISSINGLGDLIDGKAEANHTHTQYATNDATSLTPANVISWQQALGVDDLDYVEIPTESGTAESHPYVVVIDDSGKSAKRNATEFGKVDTIDGIEADENKNIALGAVRKSESNIVEDNFDLHLEGGAGVGIDAKGLKVSEGGIYSILKAESISATNQTPTPAYQFQELLFPKRAIIGTEEKVYPVTYVQGVKADDRGRVDISGVAWNYTNPSIRYSGILDKSADATFNRFALFDNSGNLSNSEKAITAFIKTLNSATDAEKSNWRIANRIGGESWGVVNVIITKVNILSLSTASAYPIPFTVTGVNFNNIKYVNLIRVKNSEGNYITEEKYNITSFSISGNSLITIDFPPNLIPDGWIVVEVVDNLFSADRSDLIEVSSVLKPLQPLSIDWTYLGVEVENLEILTT